MFNNYFDKIFHTSESYLKRQLNLKELSFLKDNLKKKKIKKPEECVSFFVDTYTSIIKKKYQSEYKNVNKKLEKFLNEKDSNLKIVWGDCLNTLKKMNSESVQLMVTSPPYYNAREYSQWKDINDYLEDMREIIKETFRVLDNHRVWVFNVGDIFDNPKTKTKSVWGKQRIPLGAYFINIFEEEGFTFVDDFIWDKGEPQSERNKNKSNPYPMYQYPLNCYEHILIFHKHRLDLTRFPCPRCGTLKVNGNTQSEPGLQSWECKNDKCFERSESNRGKRFSLKTNMTQSNDKRNLGTIDENILKKWRRDITKFSPVIKINSKGDNRIGHTAPFPEDIPEMAIKMFSYKGEVVLDPFAGSFTTPKVAAELDRVGVGIEMGKKLFKPAIIKRLKAIEPDMFKQKVKYKEFDLSKEKKLNKQI
ncbi:site-specific DNA-methyltransferase [Candidatus Pelagibacter sp.]|nr:site-specific DNA-methyltransferase [Candidatus Pelagibacter sp.]